MEERTKLFFDLEFTGLHQNTDLISIGIVSECGRTFYAESDEYSNYENSQVKKWIEKFVIPNLKFEKEKLGEDNYYHASRSLDNKIPNDLYMSYSFDFRGKETQIAAQLRLWISQFDLVEMWGDVLAYDWVLFCNLFGALNLPKNVYYIPFDLSTAFKIKGINPDIDREKFAEVGNMILPNGKFPEKVTDIPKHNSLFDAMVIRRCYKKLKLNQTFFL